MYNKFLDFTNNFLPQITMKDTVAHSVFMRSLACMTPALGPIYS